MPKNTNLTQMMPSSIVNSTLGDVAKGLQVLLQKRRPNTVGIIKDAVCNEIGNTLSNDSSSYNDHAGFLHPMQPGSHFEPENLHPSLTTTLTSENLYHGAEMTSLIRRYTVCDTASWNILHNLTKWEKKIANCKGPASTQRVQVLPDGGQRESLNLKTGLHTVDPRPESQP